MNNRTRDISLSKIRHSARTIYTNILSRGKSTYAYITKSVYAHLAKLTNGQGIEMGDLFVFFPSSPPHYEYPST